MPDGITLTEHDKERIREKLEEMLRQRYGAPAPAKKPWYTHITGALSAPYEYLDVPWGASLRRLYTMAKPGIQQGEEIWRAEQEQARETWRAMQEQREREEEGRTLKESLREAFAFPVGKPSDIPKMYGPPTPPRQGAARGTIEAYEAWEAPRGAKFALEATMPLWWLIPSAAATKAGLLAHAARHPGFWGKAAKVAAKAITPMAKAEELPGKLIGKAISGVPKKVPRIGMLPSTDNLMKATFMPTRNRMVLRRVSRIPGAKHVIDAISGIPLADDIMKQTSIVRGRLQDAAEALVYGAMARARAMRPMIKTKGGIVVDPRIKQIKPLPGGKQSMALHDIVEYAPRYRMPKDVRLWMNEIRHTSSDFALMMEKEGVPFKRIKGESDWAFVHRVVTSVKEDAAKTLADQAARQVAREGIPLTRKANESSYGYLTRLMKAAQGGTFTPSKEMTTILDDVGKLANIDRVRQKLTAPRFYDLTIEGLEAGVAYATDPLYELYMQGVMSYDMVINKRTGELLRAGLATTTRAELIEPSLTAAVAASTRKVNVLTGTRGRTGFIAHINSALRGNTEFSETSLRAIERQFPDLGGRFRAALKIGEMVDRKPLLQGIQDNAVRLLKQSQVALGRAKAARTRAMELAVSPEMGQVVGIPGISGRVIPTQVIGGQKVLGRDIAQAINKELGYARLGTMERVVRRVGEIGAIMRMSKASIDLSLGLIQGVGTIGFDFANLLAYPPRRALFGPGAMKPTAAWAKGVWHGTRSGFDLQMKYAARYWAKKENQFLLQEFAGRGSLIQPSEYMEAFGPVMRRIEKMPGNKFLAKIFQQTYGRAEIAFTESRNIMANEVRKSLYQSAKATGHLDDLAKGTNLLTLVLSTRGMGISATQRSLESGMFFFAPRMARAVAAIMGHILTNPRSYTGKLALQSITAMLVASYMFFTLGALVLGQKPKVDPRRKSMGGDGAEWQTLQTPNGEFVGLGGMLSDIRTVVDIISTGFEDPEDLLTLDMSNPIFRRMRAKFAPPTAVFYDYLSGRDYLGEVTRGETGLPSKETARMLGKWGLPIWVEAAVLEGASFPAVLTEFFGGRQFPEALWDIYNHRLVELSGRGSIDEVSDFERSRLEIQFPELVELREAAVEDMDRRGWNKVASEYWRRRTEFQGIRLAKVNAGQRGFVTGKYSGSDLRKIIQDSGRELGAQYRTLETDERYQQVIKDFEERQDEKKFAEDIAWVRYLNILYHPDLVDEVGQLDYTERDRQLNILHREVGEEIWATIEQRIELQRRDYPPILRYYYESMELLRPYWEVRDALLARNPRLKKIIEDFERIQRRDPERARALLAANSGLRQYVGRFNQQVSQLRQAMRRANPDVDKALTFWYS